MPTHVRVQRLTVVVRGADAEVDDAPARADERAERGSDAAAAAAAEAEEGELPGAQAAPHGAGGDQRRGSRADRPVPPPAGDGGASHGRGVKRPRDAVRERLDDAFSTEARPQRASERRCVCGAPTDARMWRMQVKAAASRIAEQLKEKKARAAAPSLLAAAYSRAACARRCTSFAGCVSASALNWQTRCCKKRSSKRCAACVASAPAWFDAPAAAAERRRHADRGRLASARGGRHLLDALRRVRFRCSRG